MLKFLALIPRKDDVSREFFANYYESNHSPLALKYFRGFGKYLRNHIAEELDGESPSFDVFSEFWYENFDQLIRSGKVLEGEHGPTISHDEQQFMNQPANVVLPVEEHLVQGPARCLEPEATKLSATLKRPQGMSLDDFQTKMLAACKAVAGQWQTERLSCFLVQHSDQELPWDAVMFAWPKDITQMPSWPPELAELAGRHMFLKIRSCETDLASHYARVRAEPGSTDSMPAQC